MTLNDLKPKNVWKHFFHICSIPHPSHHETALADSIIDWAKQKNFAAVKDAAGNVIIKSPGKAERHGIILQAHLDMVPQKTSDSNHDFLKDPIQPQIDPKDAEWLVATGTTLGADDGIGVAMAMALMEDSEISDAAIECLFTADEEDGMTGAAALEEKYLSGTVLINLDGEDANEMTIGCAGTLRSLSTAQHPVEAVPDGWSLYSIRLSGLLGGHSGVDIHKGRANAVVRLMLLLNAVDTPMRLVSVSGGTAANAIPRDAEALVYIADYSEAAFKTSFDKATVRHAADLAQTDPGLRTSIEKSNVGTGMALSLAASKDMLRVISSLPNGLVAMEPDIPGVPKTSSNLGQFSAALNDDVFELKAVVMVRSSDDKAKIELAHKAASHIELLKEQGWTVHNSIPDGSPAWSPNKESQLLKTAMDVYKKMHGKETHVTTTHGGLETALFRPRFPHWDMISLGPDIRYPHSPDERVNIASVDAAYAFVKELIKEIM